MMYGILADVLTGLHLLWILFNLTGFFWALKWPVLGKVHIGTLGLTSSYFLILGGCPVTDLEWRLREKALPGGAPEGTFIGHYLERLVYLPIPQIEYMIAGVTFALFVLSVYLHIVRPWRKSRAPSARRHALHRRGDDGGK
jgi:hypothetical protein